MSTNNIEQERIRAIIYRNLERLFKDLNELNGKLNSTGRMEEEKGEKVKNFGPGQEQNSISHE